LVFTFITNIFKKVVYKTVPLWYYYPINYGGTEMKKIVKAIWNVVIILVVLSIFPIVLMIDVLNAYFGFM
jgi:hypothetical protein